MLIHRDLKQVNNDLRKTDKLYDEVIALREEFVKNANHFIFDLDDIQVRVGLGQFKVNDDLKEKITSYMEDQLYESMDAYRKKLEEYSDTLFTIYCNRYNVVGDNNTNYLDNSNTNVNTNTNSEESAKRDEKSSS